MAASFDMLEQIENIGAFFWDQTMKSKISIVTLGVRNFSKSLAFYRALGFTPRNYKQGDEHVMFELEGSWLSLYPRHLLAVDAVTVRHGRRSIPRAIVA